MRFWTGYLREASHLSKDLKDVGWEAMRLSGGKASQVEVTACAKALRWGCSQWVGRAMRQFGWCRVSEGVGIVLEATLRTLALPVSKWGATRAPGQRNALL